MSASLSNSSHARSRSLRSNTLGSFKPSSAVPAQPASGPSSVTLFLTNLRLLDLDLREDWPEFTTVSLSTRDAKKRIQCIEWALYQLFVFWDPEDAQSKLQPFFPPLEPLQSLNLRAALFRCLEQVKKAGVLGRDTILRKTMLDECKGERLEEVLAVFSNAVLKKVLQESTSGGHKAIAEILSFENFSYSGERTVLSALILAHKASISKQLQRKDGLRARYKDFVDLLDLNERRITRRQEQLNHITGERDNDNMISSREVRALQAQVQKNWSGADEWLEAIIYGDSRVNADGVLATPFDKVWGSVESGRIGDLEGQKHVGLLEQLQSRVQDQEARLARWQDFGRTLSSKGSPLTSKVNDPTPAARRVIDLGFNRHQSLQVARGSTENASSPASLSYEEYTRLVENMHAELADVGKLRSATRSGRNSITSAVESSPNGPSRPQIDDSLSRDEEWSSASETDEPAPVAQLSSIKPSSFTPSTTSRMNLPHRSFHDNPTRQDRPNISISIDEALSPKPVEIPIPQRSEITQPFPQTPPPVIPAQSSQSFDPETELVDQILNSVSEASPSPKKQRHTLSLAERTRLSMSRASHSKYSDLHDDLDAPADLPRLAIKPVKPELATPKATEVEKHADLIERTRQSMAGFEASQQKAQLARRRSIKDAQRKQRESTYFPRVEEEPLAPSIDAAELIEGDPDYADVFKSRPKIATSPAASPTRIWEHEAKD